MEDYIALRVRCANIISVIESWLSRSRPCLQTSLSVLALPAAHRVQIARSPPASPSARCRPLVPAALRSALGTSSPTIFLYGHAIIIPVICVLHPAAGRELLRQLGKLYLLSHFRSRAPGCPIGTHPRTLRDHMRGCE